MAAAVSPPPFTLPATRSCLLARPNAVAGLPPAQVPPSIVFVYPLRHDDIASWNPLTTGQPRPHRQLGAWWEKNGAILSFFANVSAARASQKIVGGIRDAIRIRNVVVAWDQERAPSLRARTVVLDCLRAQAPVVVARTPPPATLATFAGVWGGHTRGLAIGAGGRGSESTNDGCCHRVEQMTFRIVSVRGTLTHATAVYRVTSFRRFVRDIPLSRVAELGRLELRDGVLTNTLTTVYFCSDPAWGATGVCGA